MSDQIIVREMRVEDAEQVRDIRYTGWLETYPNEKAGVKVSDIEHKFGSKEKEISRWKTSIETPTPGRLLIVASKGSQIVGFSIADNNSNGKSIGAMYTLPSLKGQGIGTLMMNYCLERLGTDTDITVCAAEYNERSISFYKKFGFIDTNERIIDERLRMESGAIIIEAKLVRKATPAA